MYVKFKSYDIIIIKYPLLFKIGLKQKHVSIIIYLGDSPHKRNQKIFTPILKGCLPRFCFFFISNNFAKKSPFYPFITTMLEQTIKKHFKAICDFYRSVGFKLTKKCSADYMLSYGESHFLCKLSQFRVKISSSFVRCSC